MTPSIVLGAADVSMILEGLTRQGHLERRYVAFDRTTGQAISQPARSPDGLPSEYEALDGSPLEEAMVVVRAVYIIHE